MTEDKRSSPARRSKESGVALVLVLLIAVMLSLVSAGIIFTVQTDTAVSSNYKYANEAFHVADAGVQAGVNWFANTYAPHTNVVDYNATATPVQYPSTLGQPVLLSGQSGSSSNYPDSGTISSFTSALSNQSITANSSNFGTYAVNATLLKAQGVTALFGVPASMERWRLDSIGFWGTLASPRAVSRMSAVVENDGYPFFNAALWGKDYVTVGGSGNTDSYNPDLGPYGGLNVFKNGNVGSNASVTVSGSGVINGSVAYLPPGACSGCDASHVSGSVFTLPRPRPFPPIPPFSVGTTDLSGTRTLTPGTYGNISLGPHDVLTLTAGTYYMNSLTLASNTSIVITGPVILYIQTSFSSNHDTVNAGGDPRNFQIYYNGTTAMSFTGQSDFAAVVYSPNAGIDIAGNGAYFGSFIGKYINMHGNGDIHYSEGLLKDLMSILPFHVVSWVRGN